MCQISWGLVETHRRTPPLTGRSGAGRGVGISTVPRWLPQEQVTALRTADPRAQGWDEVSWGLLGLPQGWPGPQALAGAPFRGVMSVHRASLELNVIVSGYRSLEHNGPLSPLCLHTQVFPPFRLIPRKVTLIIGATMQVGTKGHAPAPPPPAARAGSGRVLCLGLQNGLWRVLGCWHPCPRG